MSVTYIAEIGNNHAGDIELAKKMVDAAVSAGADYVKFQIYNLEKFIAPDNPYYDDFASEALGFDHFRELKAHVESRGAKFLATPFDQDSLDLLDELDVEAIKISSGDMNNRMLVAAAARLGKPLYISLGGATLVEMDATVAQLKEIGATATLLHCVVNYPASFEELNLRFIQTLATRYGMTVGYSDHSEGVEASLAAIALGAAVIEKHFTLDRSLPGGDNEMSILPGELERLVREGNNVALALGSVDRVVAASENAIRPLLRKRFAFGRDMKKGAVIAEEDLILLRLKDLNAGFEAHEMEFILGRTLTADVRRGKPVLAEGLNG